MRCPNCGYKFSSGGICPSCGDNAVLRTRAVNISIRLYNKGLEMAKSRDLSGAAETLKRSLLFDKNNVNARNVLGLVYYEMGHMADALVQWIVSQSIRKEKNSAVEYLNLYGEDMRSSEKMEDSVSLYNEALEYVKQKNDDLAVIRLKKALDINPRFIDALNLLSLCYLMRGRNNDALDIVNKVLRMDVNNPVALGYYRQLCPDKSRPDPRTFKNEMRFATYYMPPDLSKNKKVGKPLNPVIMFAVGCLCTIIVTAVLVIPSITEGYKADYETLSEEHTKLKTDFDDLTEKSNALSESMNKENQELKNQLSAVNTKELQERAGRLNTIESLFKSGDSVQAAQQLIALSTEGFGTEVLGRYNTLKQEILPVAAEEYYTRGEKAEKAGKTDEAKNDYNNVITCSLTDTQVKYDAMLRLGIIAQKLGDKESAKSYYQKVVDNHPKRAAKNEAKERYDEIVGTTAP